MDGVFFLDNLWCLSGYDCEIWRKYQVKSWIRKDRCVFFIFIFHWLWPALVQYYYYWWLLFMLLFIYQCNPSSLSPLSDVPQLKLQTPATSSTSSTSSSSSASTPLGVSQSRLPRRKGDRQEPAASGPMECWDTSGASESGGAGAQAECGGAQGVPAFTQELSQWVNTPPSFIPLGWIWCKHTARHALGTNWGG